MSKYYRTELFVILYRFEYVHILYLIYFIPSYMKKIKSGYLICIILNILSYLYVKKEYVQKLYILTVKQYLYFVNSHTYFILHVYTLRYDRYLLNHEKRMWV